VEDRLVRALRNLAGLTKHLGQWLELDHGHYPTAFASNPDEMIFLIDQLIDDGYLRGKKHSLPNQVVVTTRGMKRIADVPQDRSEPTALDEARYQRILEILHQTGVEMERHPGVYEGRGEEALRDHLLVALSPNFQSATGETFNKTGKTDILIRHEGKNVFIAECKFWSGLKVFYETIDQALGYLTWRDSKAAVICFIPNKELDPVLRQIEAETLKHPCFLKYHGERADGWYNFEFHLKDDRTRSVKVAVLCFHFPGPSREL
jgi:hypothetical protein